MTKTTSKPNCANWFQFQLVRLKFDQIDKNIANIDVSIPTGSIKIRTRKKPYRIETRFQFQLVRLKLRQKYVLESKNPVSIPTGSIKIIRTMAITRILPCFNSNWFD